MRQTSIVGMMGVVLACAVGLAALRNANALWAGALLLVCLGSVGVAVLGVLYQRGQRRAWWVGFGLFEGGYLVLAFGPWFAEQVEPKLGTTQVLNYVHTLATESPIPGPVDLTALYTERAKLAARLNATQ